MQKGLSLENFSCRLAILIWYMQNNLKEAEGEKLYGSK